MCVFTYLFGASLGVEFDDGGLARNEHAAVAVLAHAMHTLA